MKKSLFVFLLLLFTFNSFCQSNEKVVLKLAIAGNDSAASKWEQVVSAFEEKNPDVRVELTVNGKPEKIITSNIRAKKYFDVILCSTGRPDELTEKLIKVRHVENLNDVLSMTVPGENVTVEEKIIKGFINNPVCQPYGDGNTHLMPMFFDPCGLFYDAALLEENNWKVPETWDEMWELGDKAKAKGLSLFTYPTANYLDSLLFSLLYETMGPELFKKAMNFDQDVWDTPEGKKAFMIIEKLAKYTSPETPDNADYIGFMNNQQLFLEGKALFMPNSTWVVGETSFYPHRDGFKWGFTSLPAVKKGGRRASYSWCQQIWIPVQAEHKDLGKKFIAFLYSDEAASIFAQKSVFYGPSVQPVSGVKQNLTGDDIMFYSIYESGADAVIGGFAPFYYMPDVSVESTFLEPFNSLVKGNMNIKEYVSQIKKNTEKMRKKLIN